MLFRRVRIDPDALTGLKEAYAARTGRGHQKPLAAARTHDGWCVLLPDVMAVRKGDVWRLLGWHEVEQGGWNDQNRELRWEEVGGRRGSVVMEDPDRVPEVFRERVHASIVVQRHVPIDGTREGGMVSARRDLSAPEKPLDWRVHRGRGTPDDEATEAALAAALREIRHDFDI